MGYLETTKLIEICQILSRIDHKLQRLLDTNSAITAATEQINDITIAAKHTTDNLKHAVKTPPKENDDGLPRSQDSD